MRIEPKQVLIDHGITAGRWLKKPVWATMSRLKRINVPANTGVASTTKMLVPSMAQQYIGSIISFKPGWRNLRIVAMKLMPPKIELPPAAAHSQSKGFAPSPGW